MLVTATVSTVGDASLDAVYEDTTGSIQSLSVTTSLNSGVRLRAYSPVSGATLFDQTFPAGGGVTNVPLPTGAFTVKRTTMVNPTTGLTETPVTEPIYRLEGV